MPTARRMSAWPTTSAHALRAHEDLPRRRRRSSRASRRSRGATPRWGRDRLRRPLRWLEGDLRGRPRDRRDEARGAPRAAPTHRPEPGRRAPRLLRLGAAARARRGHRGGALPEDRLRPGDQVARRGAPAVPQGRHGIRLSTPTSGACAATGSCACTARPTWRAGCTGAARYRLRALDLETGRKLGIASLTDRGIIDLAGVAEQPLIEPGKRRPASLAARRGSSSSGRCSRMGMSGPGPGRRPG